MANLSDFQYAQMADILNEADVMHSIGELSNEDFDRVSDAHFNEDFDLCNSLAEELGIFPC